MRRILLVLIGGLVALILFDNFGRSLIVRSTQAVREDPAPAPEDPVRRPLVIRARDARLEYLTAQAMAGKVQPGAAPTVLVLYGTNCPLH